MKFHQDRTEDKKVMAFDNSCAKAVLSSWPRPTRKRCEPRLFLAALGQVIRCSKAVDLESLNMQFQHDWPKDKNITAVLFFLPENLETCRSYQNRCEVLFFLESETHASQIWPTLRKSYTISTLSKSP